MGIGSQWMAFRMPWEAIFWRRGQPMYNAFSSRSPPQVRKMSVVKQRVPQCPLWVTVRSVSLPGPPVPVHRKCIQNFCRLNVAGCCFSILKIHWELHPDGDQVSDYGFGFRLGIWAGCSLEFLFSFSCESQWIGNFSYSITKLESMSSDNFFLSWHQRLSNCSIKKFRRAKVGWNDLRSRIIQPSHKRST